MSSEFHGTSIDDHILNASMRVANVSPIQHNELLSMHAVSRFKIANNTSNSIFEEFSQYPARAKTFRQCDEHLQ